MSNAHVSPEACLSVVVPSFDEANTIEKLLDSVLGSPWTAEVVVVDDGSTDGTREALDARHRAAEAIGDQRLRVIFHDRNRGKGAALRHGFAEARARFVIVQDADLEYDPGDYGTLVRPLLDDLADVVYGSRFHSSQPHRVLYYWHSVGNKLLTGLSNMFTNLNLTDMETWFKAFRREVLESIELEEDRFGFEPEVTAKVAQAGWRVYEVGISYHGRTYAEGKKIGWRDGLWAVWCILKYSPLGRRLRRFVHRPGPRGGDGASVRSSP